MNERARKQISVWLIVGVLMLIIQVMLGGITRLTGSGLSITEWDVIMGVIPPLNHAQWQKAFEEYQQFPQYKIMNGNMTLSGFKNIFWWEFIHRLWARSISVVFLIPFIFFLVKKQIDKKLAKKLVIAFLLGALQGLLGWLMVSTGLKDQPWVSPISLSAHLVLALILICYLLWITLEFLSPEKEKPEIKKLFSFSKSLMAITFLQIFYGGLMAGNHAALFYPTFPKFSNNWFPEALLTFSPVVVNFIKNIAMIQLIHRVLGLLMGALVVIFYWRARKFSFTPLMKQILVALPLMVVIQITLGILTLINSLGKIPVVLAALHQTGAIILLLLMIVTVFQIRYSEIPVEK